MFVSSLITNMRSKVDKKNHLIEPIQKLTTNNCEVHVYELMTQKLLEPINFDQAFRSCFLVYKKISKQAFNFLNYSYVS